MVGAKIKIMSMEEEEPYYSVVDYLSDHSGYRCGYCKSENTNFSHGKLFVFFNQVKYDISLSYWWFAVLFFGNIDE